MPLIKRKKTLRKP